MTRTYWLGLVLVTVVLGVAGVYVFGGYAVDRFVEPRLRRSLPPTVSVRDVDFQLFPLGIQLRGSETELPASDGAPPHLRAERISINPNWSSLFGDTVTIDSLDFEGLTLDLYPGSPPQTTLGGEVDDSGWSGLLSGRAALGVPAQFLIKLFTVDNGRIRLFDAPDRPEPSFVLEPVNLTAGPISPGSLRRGIQVRADAGVASRPNVLMLQGQVLVTDHPTLTGTFHARSLPVEQLARWLPGMLSLREGTLDATAPFVLGSGGLQVEGLDMVLHDGILAFGASEATEPPPSTSPGEVPVTRTDTEPAASGESFAVSLGESRLRVENSRLQVAEEGEPRTLDVREGTLAVGSLLPVGSDVPVRGQLTFSRPDGLLEFVGSVDGTAEEFRLSDIVAGARVDRVRELDPYTRGWLPMTLKGGTFTGGLKGSVTPSELDLAVEVAFGRLRAGTGKTPGSTFMGVPVSLLLKQLSEQDGTLHLGFRVTGSPQAPRVDISAIRHRLLFRLGVDAAVLASLGLPVYVGDMVVGKVVGVSVLGEARKILGGLRNSPELDAPAAGSDRRARGTEMPKKERASRTRESTSSP